MNQSPKGPPTSWQGKVEECHKEEAGDRHLLRASLDWIRTLRMRGKVPDFQLVEHQILHCNWSFDFSPHCTDVVWEDLFWLKKNYLLIFNDIGPINILVKELLTWRHSFSHSKSVKKKTSHIRFVWEDKYQKTNRVLTFPLTSVWFRKFFLHAKPSFFISSCIVIMKTVQLLSNG